MADSVVNYYLYLEELAITEEHLGARQNKVIELIWQLGDFTAEHNPHWEIYFRSLQDRKESKRKIFRRDSDVPSITADPQTRMVFFNWVLNYSWSTGDYMGMLELQIAKTNRLIVYLKKEYKI